jgi:hypothetical protein
MIMNSSQFNAKKINHLQDSFNRDNDKLFTILEKFQANSDYLDLMSSTKAFLVESLGPDEFNTVQEAIHEFS